MKAGTGRRPADLQFCDSRGIPFSATPALEMARYSYYGTRAKFQPTLRAIHVHHKFVLFCFTTFSCLLIRAVPIVSWMCSRASETPLPIVLSSNVSHQLRHHLIQLLRYLFQCRTHFKSRISSKANGLTDKELENRHGEFLLIFLMQKKRQRKGFCRGQLIVSSTSSLPSISLSPWSAQLLFCYVFF